MKCRPGVELVLRRAVVLPGNPNLGFQWKMRLNLTILLMQTGFGIGCHGCHRRASALARARVYVRPTQIETCTKYPVSRWVRSARYEDMVRGVKVAGEVSKRRYCFRALLIREPHGPEKNATSTAGSIFQD